MAETVMCVDLSSFQKGFNFAQFADGGGLGVILKASEGTTLKDACYDLFRQQAGASKLAIASYHFMTTSDPVAQAKWFLQCANPDHGARVVCDWEDPSISSEDVEKFLQCVISERSDLQLTVYTGYVGEEAEQKNVKSEWLSTNTSLWTCQYANSPSPWASQTWPQWSLWQYTDQGRVPGFSGDVDCNRFNGPNENFLAWMGLPPPVAPPAPPIATVAITVEGNVRVSVNGVVVSTAGAMS